MKLTFLSDGGTRGGPSGSEVAAIVVALRTAAAPAPRTAPVAEASRWRAAGRVYDAYDASVAQRSGRTSRKESRNEQTDSNS